MTSSWDIITRHRELLDAEIGTLAADAPRRAALVYPSPYRAAMSSLGYQAMYSRINGMPDWCAERAVLPDDVGAYRDSGTPLLTLEHGRPVSQCEVLAFSVAYELEIAGVIDCLDLAGIEVLAADRDDNTPLVVAGGPLTFSNPAPLAPFFDVVFMGEGEGLIDELFETVVATPRSEVGRLAGTPGLYIPSVDGDNVPPVAQAPDSELPARSQIVTPNTELSSMFLTEAVRGCSRGCTYCVMRRSTNGGMRVVEPERVLGGIPDHAERVGLVGASVTDHPRIKEIVRGVVDAGRGVGISSLRADKLDDELVGLLARGGYRTLTVAADGASQRMRDVIERRTRREHLLKTAELANKHKLKTVKIYMMLGIPSETDDDVDELVEFAHELAAIHPRIAFGLAPFVAKRNTPLDGSPFAGIAVVDRRLKRLRKGLKGSAVVRPISARWAWVEYMLAQGGESAGLAVLDAHRAGGRFADYKRAFAERGCEPTGPVARVPSTSERIALHKLKLGAPA